MKKRIIALLLGAIMVFSLAACGNDGQAEATTKAEDEATQIINVGELDQEDLIEEGNLAGSGSHGGTGYVMESVQKDVLKMAVGDVPTNISPWAGSSKGRHYVINSIYQTLFDYDKVTGKYVLTLAKEINKKSDTTYEIILHEGIHDWKGYPFTAEDAVFSILQCREANNVSGMGQIKDVVQTGELSLEVTMANARDYQFASSVPMVFCVTKEAYEESPDGMATEAVGTGTYKFVEFESGSVAVLEKVEDYWGKDLADRDTNSGWYWHKQNVDRIEFMKIKEAAQQSISLEKGDVDVVEAMATKEAIKFEGNADYNVWSNIDSRSCNLYFNCGEKSPMQSVELRQAVAYAVDANGIIKAYGGYGIKATTFGAVIFADCNPDWANEAYYEYDPSKAEELIKASGFDKSQSIRIMASSSDNINISIAQALQGYLGAVGIEVKIEEYDSAAFAAHKYDEEAYDIRLDQSSFTSLADLWTQFLAAGNKEKSYAQMKDDELEEMLKKLETAEGRTKENVNAAHQRIKDQCYVYGLYTEQGFHVTTSNIVEMVYTPKLFILPGALTFKE
ncbi:MAG: ABC transporter substrate-binding protein [Lachnospiraceae bacterium]|jgi:peptide/nickel transport system substrate-binding protein